MSYIERSPPSCGMAPMSAMGGQRTLTGQLVWIPFEMFSGLVSTLNQWFLAVVATLAACAPVDIPSTAAVLNQDQIIDLIEHPARWHRHDVTVKLYPYDLGFGRSDDGWTYTACFEPCGRLAAERSPFLIRTPEARFDGYRGERSAVLRANYDACGVDHPCADLWAGVFKEIGGPQGSR